MEEYQQCVHAKIARDILWDIVYHMEDIVGPEIPFPVDRGIFLYQNRKIPLYFSEITFDYFLRMNKVLRRMLQLPAPLRYWDYTYESLKYLVGLITDDECKQAFQILLHALFVSVIFPISPSTEEAEMRAITPEDGMTKADIERQQQLQKVQAAQRDRLTRRGQYALKTKAELEAAVVDVQVQPSGKQVEEVGGREYIYIY
jgi:hypothetical protein